MSKRWLRSEYARRLSVRVPWAFPSRSRRVRRIISTAAADLGDTIQRLQAYQEAGADVLYAPGLTSEDDIATLVRSVDRPVNVLMGIPGASLNLAALSAIGVRRVSVGSALARTALGAFLRAAREMQQRRDLYLRGSKPPAAERFPTCSRRRNKPPTDYHANALQSYECLPSVMMMVVPAMPFG